MQKTPLFKTYAFAFQNLCFYLPKPMLLPSKTYAFAFQNLCFCMVIEPYLQHKTYAIAW